MKWIGDFRGDRYWLSNMSSSPINIKGLTFDSVEHFYFWASLKNKNEKDYILSIKNNSSLVKFEAKKFIKRNDWEKVKLSIMYIGLKAKFIQNEELKNKLIEIGNEMLEEGNTWNDKFWGVDYYTRKGDNNLGKLIMQVRAEILSDNYDFTVDVNKLLS